MSDESSAVNKIEGASIEGTLTADRLLHGEHGILLEINLTKGSSVPTHAHEHESFCYLIQGKLQLEIAGEARIVHSGDVWIHPEQVLHSTHALADSRWLEFKSPPEEPFS